MLPDGSYGTPYTIEEAREYASGHASLLPYPTGLIGFLLQEIETRDNIICDLRQESPFTSQAEQVREIMIRMDWGVERFPGGWWVTDSNRAIIWTCKQVVAVGSSGYQDPFTAVLDTEKWTQERQLAAAAKEMQEKMDAVSIGIFQEALRERLR